MARKYFFGKEEIEDALLRFNSQKEAAVHLGTSQMTISRLKRKFEIKHDGKILANKDSEKIDKQSKKMSENYKSGRIIPYWKGKKQSRETIEKKASKIRGKPAWNSGTKVWKYTDCEICNGEFRHSPNRKRRFCSRDCSSIHMSNLYKGERLKGENNPNYGNGSKIKEAHKRGCYINRKLPEYTRGKRSRYKGYYLRSSWELEYAKYLDSKGVNWSYEPKRFTLSDGRTYTPDFYLIDEDKYIEIKGYWYEKAKQKFLQFREEHPEIKIQVIESKIWNQ